MTGQTENKYFTEPPNYTQAQQNKQVLIVAAETVLTQTLTLMYRCTDPQADTQTNRWTRNRKKSKKTNTVVNTDPPCTEYLYYPIDVEGVTLKRSLLPASAR